MKQKIIFQIPLPAVKMTVMKIFQAKTSLRMTRTLVHWTLMNLRVKIGLILNVKPPRTMNCRMTTEVAVPEEEAVVPAVHGHHMVRHDCIITPPPPPTC